jgi:hypothetical protein
MDLGVNNYLEAYNHLEVYDDYIGKMNFTHWEPSGVCEKRRRVNLEAPISAQN